LRTTVTTRKDFWTGVLYVAIGLGALLMARNYAFGSIARMGPGYFPTAVALLLVIIGAVIAARSLFADGASIGHIVFKPIALLLGSTVAFGFLINRAGLIVAALVLVLGCAGASDRFRLQWIPLLGMAALIAFCAVVFVFGMGIPMPLVGPWLSFGGQ
jgi:uncharacterized membrane protein YhaH (DUF805 family)